MQLPGAQRVQGAPLISNTGSPRIGAQIGHVDFMLFVSISYALCSAYGL